MKIKVTLSIAILLAFSAFANAQNSVKITPKKTTYKRTANDIPDHKKTFTITYPVITGNGPIEKIRESISYWKNFDTDLAETKTNYWTSEMSYVLNYNGNGILDLTLIHSGSGAYPSDHLQHVIVDLRSGSRLKIKNAFSNRDELYKMIITAYEAEKRKALAEVDEEDIVYYLKDSTKYYSIYEIEDFTVSDKGVTFIYDYNFPHVNKANQPDGRYFFTWKQLKPFIEEYDALGKFLKKD